MKILKVRLKNLNSLRGEWCIDFTRPEFLSVSIFAIDGPTGASKSTVLDAICLALYGMTRKKELIDNFDNPFITARSNDCFAEVSFDSNAGEFKCYWSLIRNEKGAIEHRHDLLIRSTDEIVESGKDKVVRAIEDKSGLDFDRFHQTELIAYEGYASFLNEIVEKQAPKVSTINGAEFSVLQSRRTPDERVHEHETTVLKHNLWKEEQIAIYQKTIIEKQENLERIYTSLAEHQKIQEQLIQNNKLQDEITELSIELVQVDRQLQSFTNERAKLERVQRAAKVEDCYANLSLLRKQAQSLHSAIEFEASKIAELEKTIRLTESRLKSIEENSILIEKESRALTPLFNKIRTLDQSIETHKLSIEQNKSRIRSTNELLVIKQQELGNLLTSRESAQMTLTKVADYLREKSQDSALSIQYPLIESSCVKLNHLESVLLSTEEKIKTIKENLELNSLKIVENKSSLSSMEKTQIDVQIKIEQRHNELEKLLAGRLLREFRTEKDTLLRELCFLQKIARLEEERQAFLDENESSAAGKGSTQQTHGTAEIELTEKKIMGVLAVLNQADSCTEDTETLTATDQDLMKKIEWINHEQNALLTAQTEMTNACKTLEIQVTNLQSEFIELSNSTTRELAAFGIFDFSNPSLALNNLAERLKFWEEMNQHKTSVEAQLKGLEIPIQSLELMIENQKENLVLIESEQAASQKAYEAMLKEREALFGDKKPDLEEKRLESARAKALQSDFSLNQDLAQSKQQLDSLQECIQGLREQSVSTSALLTKSEADFIQELYAAAFVTEADFVESLMPLEERFNLEKQLGELENKKVECSQRLKDKKGLIITIDDNNDNGWTLMKLEPIMASLNKEAKQLDQEITELSERLEDQREDSEQLIEEQPLMV